MAMRLPVQITFRNVESSDAIEEWIRAEADKLETFYDRILSCRVTVELPHRHHKLGKQYQLRIELGLPGGKLVINRRPDLGSGARQMGKAELNKQLEVETPHKILRLAINDAFKAAGRRLEDYARRRRGAVKSHEPLPEGRISRVFPEERYGFLTTPDGREIYFHEDSVLNRGFRGLKVGAAVTFVEEQGEKGAQASTVRVSRKHGVPKIAGSPVPLVA